MGYQVPILDYYILAWTLAGELIDRDITSSKVSLTLPYMGNYLRFISECFSEITEDESDITLVMIESYLSEDDSFFRAVVAQTPPLLIS